MKSLYVKAMSSIFAVAALLAIVRPATACPPGQYEDGWFHVCLPYGPKLPANIVPGQLSCVQWAAHPDYFEAVFAINHTKDELAKVGITNESSCIAAKGRVASIIRQYYDFEIGVVADDLFRCACMNAEFSSLAGTTHPYLRCRINPSKLPPNAPVASCDSQGTLGSACTCPNFSTGNTYPGIMDSFPRITGMKCVVDANVLPPGTPKTLCDVGGFPGSPCSCPNFATGGVYPGHIVPF